LGETEPQLRIGTDLRHTDERGRITKNGLGITIPSLNPIAVNNPAWPFIISIITRARELLAEAEPG
jgi:hypothetical protein